MSVNSGHARTLKIVSSAALILWIGSIAFTIAHPIWIGLQATAWLAAIALVLVLLPRWYWRIVMLLLIGMTLLIPHFQSPSPASAEALRVVSINTQIADADRAELIEKISDLDPDIVILVETTTEEATAVSQALSLTLNGSIANGGLGVGILTQDATVQPELAASLHQNPVVDKRGTKIVGVHTAAPVTAELVSGWQSDFSALAEISQATTPVILVGDFNATHANPTFRSLGLNDCAPTTPTWPARAPIIGIDHILVNAATCGANGILRITGTDHLGVWADVILAQNGIAATQRVTY